MHEVQKKRHRDQPRASTSSYTVITNKDFWEKLPEDVRKGLDEALKESTDYANQIARRKRHWKR